MGRGATTASDNVWYQARREAAKKDPRLESRSGAAEAAGMSEDAVKNTELGLEKQMPAEKAITLADLYQAPQLLNHFCIHDCPIGERQLISAKKVLLPVAVINLIRAIQGNQLSAAMNTLLESASTYGRMSEEQTEELKAAMEYFRDFGLRISELLLAGEEECLQS